MKFAKNKLSIFNNDNQSFTIVALIAIIFIVISVALQIILLLLKEALLLIIIDSILITILLIIILYFLLLLSFSSITIKNEVVVVKNMLFITKVYPYEDIKSLKINDQNTSSIFGKTISAFNENNTLLFKFSYDQKAYDLIDNKIHKSMQKKEQILDDSYEKYYNKIKSKNN